MAGSHSFERRMLIDGKLVDGEAGTFPNVNPATEMAYVEYDPNPCIWCGPDWGILRIEDPVINRALVQAASVRQGLERVQIEADGSVLFR